MQRLNPNKLGIVIEEVHTILAPQKRFGIGCVFLLLEAKNHQDQQ